LTVSPQGLGNYKGGVTTEHLLRNGSPEVTVFILGGKKTVIRVGIQKRPKQMTITI